MSRKARILAFLRSQPHDWHYGLDIAKKASVTRASVYVYLGRLEEQGKVQRRLDPAPLPPKMLARTQYRITNEGLRDAVSLGEFTGALA